MCVCLKMACVICMIFNCSNGSLVFLSKQTNKQTNIESQLLTPIKINCLFVSLIVCFLISQLQSQSFYLFFFSRLFRKCFRFCCYYYYWHLFMWISLLIFVVVLLFSLLSQCLLQTERLYSIESIQFKKLLLKCYIMVGQSIHSIYSIFESNYINPSVLLNVQFNSIIYFCGFGF